MAKNEIKDVSIIITVVLALLFFYVYQRIQILRIGYRIKDVDSRIMLLSKENSLLKVEVSRLLSPDRIAGEVNRLGLDLIPPKEKQIIRIK